MMNTEKGKLLRENKQLKAQLDNAKHELSLVKGSRAYNMARLLGHAKSQFIQSPVVFSKRVARKVLSRGGLKGISYVSKNISSMDEMELQYKDWILFNEPDDFELGRQRQQSDDFAKKPLISIITPVFNPPVAVLEDLIQSVLKQTYPKFELCLGDFGTDQDVKDLIAKYARKDPRVKTWAFENKGIAANSNLLLAKAEGDYIALLDHDDTLSPDALYENVSLMQRREYDFIYSDKDKIDEAGNRFEPFFKPGWSPDIMLNANYLTHLNVMRTSIVKKVGGWSSDTDGAQDWDLFLKVVAESKTIGHIPKVLYHWRVISTSTAMSIETKPYALQGQRNAVDRYLKSEGIPAHSYHVGSELLLQWDKGEGSCTVIVRSTSSASLRLILSAMQSSPGVEWVVFHSYQLEWALKTKFKHVSFVSYDSGKYHLALRRFLARHEGTVVLATDAIDPRSINDSLIKALSGWLNVGGVLGVGPRVVDFDSKIAIECGAFVTKAGLKPVFAGSPPYHQTPLGNIEWIRDFQVLSGSIFCIAAPQAVKALRAAERGLVVGHSLDDDYTYTAMQLCLGKMGRLVFNPKAYVRLTDGPQTDVQQYYDSATAVLADLLPDDDPYFNSNLSSEDPMRLIKITQEPEADESIPEIEAGYKQEAMVHAMTRTLTAKEMANNSEHISVSHAEKLSSIRSALFILPDFQAIYAGLNNIFSFADFLRQQGVKINIAIMADGSLERQKELIGQKYPELGERATLLQIASRDVNILPTVDIAICTQWATAYILARFNKTKRKCYFIQDKEASFYPKGSISALVENTYTFGFYALANTKGLLDWYQREFHGQGIVLPSNVNLSTYAPPEVTKTKPKTPYKVFFYARPNEPRNAFEVGVAGLIKLKNRLKDDVEIFAAGADWDPAVYGLQDVLTNMGKIAYDKLPEFYRSMDAGMMLMFSGHPGVVASELMASGCPVVVNAYNDVTWNNLYKHEKTCLVGIPTADALADNLLRALSDHALRERLIPSARKKVMEYYGDYDELCERTLQVLKHLN